MTTSLFEKNALSLNLASTAERTWNDTSYGFSAKFLLIGVIESGKLGNFSVVPLVYDREDNDKPLRVPNCTAGEEFIVKATNSGAYEVELNVGNFEIIKPNNMTKTNDLDYIKIALKKTVGLADDETVLVLGQVRNKTLQEVDPVPRVIYLVDCRNSDRAMFFLSRLVDGGVKAENIS